MTADIVATTTVRDTTEVTIREIITVMADITETAATIVTTDVAAITIKDLNRAVITEAASKTDVRRVKTASTTTDARAATDQKPRNSF